MDANGTRFHLVLGERDWLPPPGTPAPDGAEWDAATATVALARLPIVFPPRRAERPPAPADRRGAARDRFGNWYAVGADGRSIVARSHHDAAPVPFWPGPAAPPAPPSGGFAPAEAAAPPPPPRLSGLAVVEGHYLVAGNLDVPGLLVFDLAAGGPPSEMPWPAGVPFQPLDLCAVPGGGVWILDAANRRLWALDRRLRVRAARPATPLPPPDFAPADGGAGEAAPPREGPVSVEQAADLAAIDAPVAVEALPDGSALVLGRRADGPVLHRVALEEGPTAVLPLAPLLDDHPTVAAELPHGMELAFVADAGAAPGTLDGTAFVATPNGNQSFAFRLAGPPDAPRLGFEPRFFPMRRWGGRALVVAGGEAHYDSGERWVSLLEYPRPAFAREAALLLPADPAHAGAEAPRHAFDGREPGCVWHRLFLDACIPPDARVTVESRAGDSAAELEAAPWTPEPRLYLRGGGPELPFRRVRLPGDDAHAGSWELLFQHAVGRYLQLRVTLSGNGRITPRLRALRAYYPRFSYLREYLPAAYREDAGSAWFLDRFLSNVEGSFTELEGRIAAAQMLFDTRTVPPELLEWLAGWMGAALDASWSEAKRRFFLANALRMFAGRGTRDGLVRALRLALEECVDPALFDRPAPGAFTVRVVERFLTRAAAGVAYGDVGERAGPGTTAPALAWTPAQGAEPLHARWRGWLAGQYGTVAALRAAWGPDEPAYASFDDPRLALPSLPPAAEAKAADWRRFLREGLGFTWAVPDDAADLALWRGFLARRHRHPAELNRAWARPAGQGFAAFDAVPYPAALPARGGELADWIAFVSGVVPIGRGAHRLTVLVPVAPGDTREDQRRRQALALRIARLEKPAHTLVETRLYWAAFRVGEARLGHDTVLARGARFTALELDRGELAESYLGWIPPWSVADRPVVGRDAAARSPSTATLQRWT